MLALASVLGVGETHLLHRKAQWLRYPGILTESVILFQGFLKRLLKHQHLKNRLNIRILRLVFKQTFFCCLKNLTVLSLP